MADGPCDRSIHTTEHCFDSLAALSRMGGVDLCPLFRVLERHCGRALPLASPAAGNDHRSSYFSETLVFGFTRCGFWLTSRSDYLSSVKRGARRRKAAR